MATVAELQKIADEVSEAFHRPTWNIVVVDKGVGKPCEVSSHRIVVPRSWLANPEPAKLRFGLVLFEVFTERGFYTTTSRFSTAYTVIALAYFVLAPQLVDKGVYPGVVLAVFILLLAGLYGHRAVVAFIRRRFITEDFLKRLLEASKDPESVRAYLKKEKVSPEMLAKFEAMVAAQG